MIYDSIKSVLVPQDADLMIKEIGEGTIISRLFMIITSVVNETGGYIPMRIRVSQDILDLFTAWRLEDAYADAVPQIFGVPIIADKNILDASIIVEASRFGFEDADE